MRRLRRRLPHLDSVDPAFAKILREMLDAQMDMSKLSPETAQAYVTMVKADWTTGKR
jgi:hypothetical protein